MLMDKNHFLFRFHHFPKVLLSTTPVSFLPTDGVTREFKITQRDYVDTSKGRSGVNRWCNLGSQLFSAFTKGPFCVVVVVATEDCR